MNKLKLFAYRYPFFFMGLGFLLIAGGTILIDASIFTPIFLVSAAIFMFGQLIYNYFVQS